MKSKSIIVAAFLALTRPAAAAADDPGDVVTQSLQIEMPDILGRSAIETVVSCQPGERRQHCIVKSYVKTILRHTVGRGE
jgi:hypothetical protein